MSTGATASTPKQIQQEHTSTTRSQSARAASSGATAPATATTNIGVHTPIKDKPSSPLMTATGKQPARYSNIPSPSDVDMTSDYWIREGRLWKRARIIPRTVLYCPEASDGGPPENLIPTRMTIIKPEDGSKPRHIDDKWTIEPQPRQVTAWTGSTNFEEKAAFKEHLESDDEDTTQATKAKALTMPKQPSQQDVQEHNLTHLPCRSWCPICVRGRGKSTSHQKQTSRKPIIQIDFAYLKGFQDTQAVPISRAIAIETGLCMAGMLPTNSNCLNMHPAAYICEIESRRHPSIRPRAHLKALAQDVAAEIGTLSIRHALHAPAYSSQSQGNIERLHQTPFGQVRIIREMIRQTYNVSLSMNHPVTPWLIISRSAHLINTNLAHSYGHTSYFRRWQCDNKLPIWEFGETILYMIPGEVKHQPKLENRFSPGIWLGKDTTSGESFIGITRRIVKARTIKRQAAP